MTSSERIAKAIKGRGAIGHPAGRFESRHHQAQDDGWFQDPEPDKPRTILAIDKARSVLMQNDSPDVPFELSVNPYRGCEHGCVYCFARPSHAYLNLSPGLDFETHLFHKPDAAERLEAELRKPGYRCKVIALGINTDAYQPVERRTRLTRSLLEVMQRFKQPVSIVTKSALVERDLDILVPMAEQNLASVLFSITTLDHQLSGHMEPRASAPRRRLKALATLSKAGVPTGVLFAPVIPALNDHEMEAVITAASEAGATSAGYVLLRLPWELKAMFETWLDKHYPLKKQHVLSLLRQLHEGQLYQPKFGHRMRGSGPLAETITGRFRAALKRAGLQQRRGTELDCSRFQPPPISGQQFTLW